MMKIWNIVLISNPFSSASWGTFPHALRHCAIRCMRSAPPISASTCRFLAIGIAATIFLILETPGLFSRAKPSCESVVSRESRFSFSTSILAGSCLRGLWARCFR